MDIQGLEIKEAWDNDQHYSNRHPMPKPPEPLLNSFGEWRLSNGNKDRRYSLNPHMIYWHTIFSIY